MPKDKEKAEKKIKRDFLSELLDFVKDMAIIILVVMFIRSFLVMPFQISGQSMYSSYYNYQFIIVDRFSYLDIPLVKTGKVERGDVVVFRPHVSKDKEYFIKRIIGLPGESVKIS
ncbi:MAG: signal peptidase I [Candidatus Peribacteria bacterium]|nr:MAG: signal peptidase I [Candidatus Peribacteria bacterium]